MKSLRKYSSITILMTLLIVPLIAQTDVTLDIGDVSYPAYTDSLLVPLTLTGPTDAVAGVQFDLVANPAMTELLNVFPDAAIEDFSADFSSITPDTNRVIFYNSGAVEPLPAAGDTILWLLYDGTGIVSAVIDIEMYSAFASDTSGGNLTVTAVNGSIAIGSVVSLEMSTGTGDINETVDLTIDLVNPDLVGGVQFDLMDIPDYLILDSIWTTTRTAGFTISTSTIETGDRVILYSDLNESIASGTGPILNVRYTIIPTAYNIDVVVNIADAVITDDLGGTYWVAGVTPGIVTVFPGYLEPPTNLVATSNLDGHVPLSWDPPVWSGGGGEFTEDFETGEIPGDWTTTTNSTVGGWFATEDGSSEYFPIPLHTWYACSNDDAANDDGSLDYLITPSVSTISASAVILTFESFFTGEYSQTAHLEVSTDGVSFTEISTLTGATEWVTESYDLSAYIGEENLYIAFHSNDNGAWASGWAVDDIALSFSDNSGIVTHIVHYKLSELGEWVLTTEKLEVVDRYPNGITYDMKIDYSSPIPVPETRNTRDLTAYNIYRSTSSPVAIEPGNLLATVPTTQETYDDADVVNGITSYYVVTGDYGAMGESGPSNEAAGTPVEWVELGVSGGSALSGQTDTLDIFLNNESDVNQFFLEIADIPDYLVAIDVIPTARVNGFTVDVLEGANGNMSIMGFTTSATLAPGDGPICRVVVLATAPEPANLDLNIVTASILDAMNNQMPWTAAGSIFEVTVETQHIVISGAIGVGTATVSLMLDNTTNIAGFEMLLVDTPGLVSGMSIIPVTTDVDWTNWTLDAEEIGGAYKILGFDNTLSNRIEPGMHHIADITFAVSSDPLDWGTVVYLAAVDVILLDDNTPPVQLYTEVHTSAISIGYPDAVFSVDNLVHEYNEMNGSFDIVIQNQVTVNALVLDIMDMPNYLTVTNIAIIPGGPFANGFIDASSGEMADGTVHISGFDFSTGITPTLGAIMRVDFDVSPNYPANHPLMIMITGSIAADQNSQQLNSMASGYIMFSPVVGVDGEVELPDKFALHFNYPNPFNPATNIRYDLSEVSLVKLTIYDMMGREVRTLVDGTQQPGKMVITWDGSDQSGRPVSAGVYLYRLWANNHVATSKMILLK